MVGEEFFEESAGFGDVTRPTCQVGDVVAGGERVGVVGAQHPLLVGEEYFEESAGFGDIPRLTCPVGDVVASGERVGVVGA